MSIDVEGQLVPVREPFDHRSCPVRDSLDDGGIRLAVCLALDVVGELPWAIVNLLGALKSRSGGGNETGRQRRRACGHGIALNHYYVDARLLRRQRRA